MFLCVQVTTSKEGETACAVFKFDSIVEAKANYHYFLTSSYSNQNLAFFMASIINNVGESVVRESYYAPIEETEIIVEE